jgi:hypothetical protein
MDGVSVIISLIARLWGWSDISSVDDIFHLPLTLTRISRSHVGSVRLLSRISGGESMTAPPTKSFRNCSCHITATNWIGVPHVLAVWKGIDPGFLLRTNQRVRRVLSDNQSIRAICMTLSRPKMDSGGNSDGIPPEDYEPCRLVNGSMWHWSPARARAWEL